MKMPFTIEQFFRVFEKYNSAIFPLQILIFFFGVVSVFLLHSNYSRKHRLIGGYLGFLWIWSGLVYHMIFFADINKTALIFGTAFIVQGLLTLATSFSRNSFVFMFERRAVDYTGYFFILFGLVVYPLISNLAERPFGQTISIGLPCPSAIVTFGFLMLNKGMFPIYLFIIPLLWSVVGISAAINFGVYQDFMMPIAAITAGISLIRKRDRIIPVRQIAD